MKLGSNDISSVKIGSTDVNKIYIGSTEVWSAANPLLDDYPGAAAAYSLRQLKSGVTNSIRVRRASDNAEINIGFVSGELDTTTLQTFCSGTNGFVTTWYDQSGNGNDATQSTAASQPQIVLSGSVILENGKPIVTFDGVDDYLDNNSFSQIGASGISAFVVQQSTPDVNTFLLDFGYNVPVSARGAIMLLNRYRLSPFLDYQTSGFEGRYDNTGNYIDTARAGNSTSSQFIGTAITDGTYNIGYANGNKQGQINISTPYDFSVGLRINNYISASFFFKSNVQEIVVYNSDQSSNRTGIETNINNFYNIY